MRVIIPKNHDYRTERCLLVQKSDETDGILCAFRPLVRSIAQNETRLPRTLSAYKLIAAPVAKREHAINP